MGLGSRHRHHACWCSSSGVGDFFGVTNLCTHLPLAIPLLRAAVLLLQPALALDEPMPITCPSWAVGVLLAAVLGSPLQPDAAPRSLACRPMKRESQRQPPTPVIPWWMPLSSCTPMPCPALSSDQQPAGQAKSAACMPHARPWRRAHRVAQRRGGLYPLGRLQQRRRLLLLLLAELLHEGQHGAIWHSACVGVREAGRGADGCTVERRGCQHLQHP